MIRIQVSLTGDGRERRVRGRETELVETLSRLTTHIFIGYSGQPDLKKVEA